MPRIATSLWIGCLSAALLLTGCNTGNNTASGAFPQNTLNSPATRVTPQSERNVVAAQSVAHRVVQVANVRNASVFLANRTAYVAVQMRPGATTTLTQQTKGAIVAAVKSSHPEIKRVMVTANADAFHQFQTYGREVSQGKPVTGVWNRFNAMVQRIWPQSS